jgi:hypothetical protein
MFERMLKIGFLVVLCVLIVQSYKVGIVNEIGKYLLKPSKCLLNFVGECGMGFLLGEFMSLNRNISTKEMLFYGDVVKKVKLSLCLTN